MSADDRPDVIFAALLPILGEILDCDRCFLYLRNPKTRIGKVTHCWLRNSQYPNLLNTDWQEEPDSLAQEDPLFAAALQAKPSIFVEDVATASPAVVNRAFEQKNFGHRALVHAHLHQDNLLWGILQPCIFNDSRVWTALDRQIIAQVVKKITPLVIAFVNFRQE